MLRLCQGRQPPPFFFSVIIRHLVCIPWQSYIGRHSCNFLSVFLGRTKAWQRVTKAMPTCCFAELGRGTPSQETLGMLLLRLEFSPGDQWKQDSHPGLKPHQFLLAASAAGTGLARCSASAAAHLIENLSYVAA